MALRPVKFIVQPILVQDDGANLIEYPVEPLQVPASELDSFPSAFAAWVADANASDTTT